MTRWLLAALFSLGPVAAAAQGVQLGCNRLELVLDSRLDAQVVEQAWASGEARAEAPAVLELRGCNGESLDRLELEAPLAKLDPSPLRGAPGPTYLVSVDLTQPAGSYNGPLTIPVRVLNRRLQRVHAMRPDGQREPIHLAATGKAAWQKHRVKGVDDLLEVSCRPDSGGKFVVFYRRYHPTRSGWSVRQRSKPGFWESDHPFPTMQLFP